MSNSEVVDRSPAIVDLSDLEKMGRLAKDHFDDFFRRLPRWQAYSDRLLAIALCQGGALHYLDQHTGLKDIDLWAFFAEIPGAPFPARAGWARDYGPSKFGRHPTHPDLAGRQVDIFGRSLKSGVTDDPASAIVKWLQTGGRSPTELAKKAVVLVYPATRIGQVVWPRPQ
jgi:hypothetical protein